MIKVMTRLWFLVFLSGTLAAVEDNNVIARVHFASCNKPHVPTPLWDIMNDRSGNLLILGGDVSGTNNVALTEQCFKGI